MSLLVLSNIVSSGRPLPAGDTVIPVDAVPMPLPIAAGEPNPGGRVRAVVGTEGDDTLVLEGGATGIGGGGDDTFVLVSNGDAKGVERLGAILDFNAGDTLDLSRLGANARILGREDDDGGTRISIDYDGDGKEDGFVLTFETGQIAPSPDDGEFHILPFPMPGDGEVVILPVDFDGGIGDGEFHILPFPMPGDGWI
ncbi:MAG: hypothetical protein EPN98_05575 [Phenylobacterium sp.]|uniref:hypothetical protein n=1 Tax=Phenylobacterium sp. TaxID=1871053 RepID=UPI00121138C7|nr:hypothetical protein [Phenylobacterium sp.]TAL36006.1 MAG: hypothetical protein EPN98_05575 [Phenylobacterium sp.]